MKIENETNWDTLSLKKFSTYLLRWSEKGPEGKLPDWQRKNLTIQVIHSKRTTYSGYALYDSTWMKLFLPKEEINVERLARLFLHELDHIRGYRHNQMPKWYDMDIPRDIHLWTISSKQIIEKPKKDIQLVRYERVKQLVDEKKAKLARLQKQLKKWTQKQKYYERVLAAAGKLPKEEK